MRLDPALWTTLEEHGVTVAHMEMLARLLQVQRNGYWGWQYVQGQLVQCDARLTFPSREVEVRRVYDVLFDGNSLLR